MDSSSSMPQPPVTGASLFWLIGLIPPLLGLHIGLSPGGNAQRWRWLWYLGPVAVISLTWVHVASHYVPEPYLDEVFHIPQAQRYGQGKYWEWDDKLTTPPGLYASSLLLLLISGAKSRFEALTPFDLRATNVVALLILGYLALLCRHEVTHLLSPTSGTAPRKPLSSYTLHTAMNICLFPLLFFFSGLYYTDVASTAAVLASFLNHLRRVRRCAAGEEVGLVSDLVTLFLGIVTLFMRQTNVFWTVVFMGGLEAVHAVKSLNPRPAIKGAESDGTIIGEVKYFLWRSCIGDVHDVPLSSAWVEDWVLTAVSLIVGGICNPFRVLKATWPYMAILASFAGFVFWNGGVVLGDKTNHVATVHLPQMLYIWPFFAFFSLPLLLPYALTVLDGAWSFLLVNRKTTHEQKPKPVKPVPVRSVILAAHYLLGTIVLSLAIVHLNTIIHPFTLADNRHYMFYVFRYTIRRAEWVKYGLVAAHTVSRWLIWGVFSGSADAASATTSTDKGAAPKLVGDGSTTLVPTSTGIIFLLATSLSLITAPLVEPRYFIIPWVIWRILLPAWYIRGGVDGGMIQAAQSCNRGVTKRVLAYSQKHDVRLVLETAWFMLVNLATMAIFILKPYQWKAEDGTLLDEGRLQRFMW